MDRHFTYAGAIPLETDLLNASRDVMVGLAKLSQAVFGTPTIVSGLACVPTGVPSMTVNVNKGEIYSLQNIDNTAYSSLPADTTDQILKQGISLATTPFVLAAPATGGYSVNYLIQAQYQDSDTNSLVLPYYNASNPTTAWNGPNNTGVAQPTERKGLAVIQAKQGIAAASGTQLTPAADSGFVPLYVVAIAYGQTTITTANIAPHPQAPFLNGSLLQSVQLNAFNYTLDTGSANAYAAAYYPAISTLTDGQVLWFKALNTNTGASTFVVNGGTVYPLVGPTHLPLAASSILSGGQYQVIWHAGIASWALAGSGSGGGLTNITPQSPLTSTGGSNPTLSIPAATGAVNGYLLATDWTTFNNKGTLTSVSVVNANGVSAISSGGATPSLTFSLGAITPTSVACTGAIVGTSFNRSSDRRLKKDIRRLRIAKDSVESIRLYQWVWNRKAGKGLAGKESSGVLADDVEKVFPSCVSTDDKGFKTVDYGLLAVHLILARD